MFVTSRRNKTFFRKEEKLPTELKVFFLYGVCSASQKVWQLICLTYCIWSFKIRLQRVHDYYPAPSGHLTRGHVLYLLPGAFAIFSPREELEFFFFFFLWHTHYFPRISSLIFRKAHLVKLAPKHLLTCALFQTLITPGRFWFFLSKTPWHVGSCSV